MSRLLWIRELEGTSGPWEVADLDDLDDLGEPRRYVLKHFRRGDLQNKIAEYVGAKVAEVIEIGAPPAELLKVGPDFLDSLRRLGSAAPANLDEAHPGLHIGILYDDAAGPVTRDRSSIAGLKNGRQPGDIVGVDTLVQNPDRKARNLLLRAGSVGRHSRHELVAIDWGHTFSGATRPDRLGEIVEDRTILAHEPLLHVITSSDDFAPIRQRIRRWGTPSHIRSLVHWLPSEWDIPQGWLGALEDYLLRRVDVALEALEPSEEAATLFPNWQYSHEL